MRLLLLLLFCGIPYFAQAKVLIFTIVFNRPEFIELQKKSFDAFLLDEYDYVVYNNAADSNIAREIEQTCQREGVRHVRIPDQDRRNLDPCTSHATALNYAVNDFLKWHQGKTLLLENDDFLIQPISIEAEMTGIDFGYKPFCWMWDPNGKWVGHPTIYYPHANMAFFDFSTITHPELINWHGTLIEGYRSDTGGHMYAFLHSEPKMRTKQIDEIASWDYQPNRNFFERYAQKGVFPVSYIPLMEELIANLPSAIQFINHFTVLHYWVGSNWDNRDQAFHDKKFMAIHAFLDKVIAESGSKKASL